MRAAVFASMLLLGATPALAFDAAMTTVTCAAGVTTGLGTPQQAVRDIAPTDLPVLAYRAVPAERDYKQLMRLGDVPVRLYVYRVNAEIVHMQIFEESANGKQLLADTVLSGDNAELSYRPPGGREMVTAYCF